MADEPDLNRLELLLQRSPAWRLLSVTHSAFIIHFLHRLFVAEQGRQIPEHDLLGRLDDHLELARARPGETTFRRSAKDYLDEWASDRCGWLRASVAERADHWVYDLTPPARRAIDWVLALEDRSFVGTESRLLSIFELLKQIRSGSETDPVVRMRELEAQRDEIEAEIRRVARFGVTPMSDAMVRDRFQLAALNASSLLADLAEVEQNFRRLDRETRTSIAQWEGAKGTLLANIIRHRSAIQDSDQGRSFRAFFELLMSPSRKEELVMLLSVVRQLPALQGAEERFQPDITHAWWLAADQAQSTVARLSEQLRCFLDERTALENRRIIQLLREIESYAVAVRDKRPDGQFHAIQELTPDIMLPLDRPLFSLPIATQFDPAPVEVGVADADAGALFDQIYIDPLVLASHVRDCLATQEVVTLAIIVEDHPLEHGVAELMGYLRLASSPSEVQGFISDEAHDLITWTDAQGTSRCARVPRVIFHR